MARPKRLLTVVAAIGIAAFTLAACSSNGSSTSTTAGSGSASAVKSGGSMTMALDENLAGFNINTSAASEYVLQEILDVVWPQPYIVNAALKPVLNTELISSVKVTTNPQTITYNINPKAVWQDGVPIDADDFIYNWQAQSGISSYTDVGGKPYDAASTSGYDQIASVTGSNPPGGAACDPGSTADRNVGLCPNGKTVTVKYSTPFADWQGLFTNIVPAHIARTVGWNTGFSGASQTISGSWYEIQSYTNNQSVVLVRNPKYWGTPGKLDKIIFSFFNEDTQEVPALQNNEVQVINPTSVSTSIVQTADQIPNVTKAIVPGLEFEHLDFNQADPYLAKLQVRQAIAYGTNRQEIIAHTVGEISPGLKPLGNRMFVATQPQYVDNGGEYASVNDSKATSLLKGLGFTKASDGYFQANYGPQKGQDLTFTIQSTTGNAIRSQTEQLFQAQMKQIGIKIDIQNYDANTFFGTNLPNGTYQIAEFAWVAAPFVSENQSIYCSYTNTNMCDDNWIHYANPQVDKLMAEGSAASSPTQEAADYNAADKILWQDMATLPLYQTPEYFAWTSTYGNVIPNTSEVGVPWNGNLWGVKSA
jgi:peptide/nickel transport system substrate-binding protein